MPQNASSHYIADIFLASYLILSPAWAQWVNEVNALLTMLSLLIGIGFGLVRLWFYLKRRL